VSHRVEEIQLSLIDEGERARTDYKDVTVLARGIQENGLINAIAVYEKPGSDQEKPFLLLAGGRRLHAHRYLKAEKIPCRIYDHVLTDLEIKSIELEENLNREDLEYYEEIQLKKEILELQQSIHGKKISTSPDAPGVSMADTAKMLNISPASLSKDMKIAKAMERFPDLQWDKMKSKSDAMKVVNSIGTSLHRMEVAKEMEAQLGAGDSRKKKLYDAFQIGDFFKKVQELPNNYFDLVEIDPPYAIDLQKKKKDYNYEGYNEVPEEEYLAFIQNTLSTCYDKMTENSWLILWFAPEPWFNFMGDMLRAARFQTTGLVGIWNKTTGQTHMPHCRLANSYEMFYYAWKGAPTLAKQGSTNIFTYTPTAPSKKTHPTERPLDLMVDILTTFTVPGARVLVPFAGSGITLISAFMNNMLPIGFDLTRAYKDGYVLRVNEIFP
jgi:site-specific DNA-methyltransferase (adenine-specific)